MSVKYCVCVYMARARHTDEFIDERDGELSYTMVKLFVRYANGDGGVNLLCQNDDSVYVSLDLALQSTKSFSIKFRSRTTHNYHAMLSHCMHRTAV